MTDWYFEFAMNKLDSALSLLIEKQMTLKQRDAFHKKMHYAMNKTPQPQLIDKENDTI